MAKMVFALALSLGLCSAFGETQESRMLDSLTHHFLTDTEDALALHQKLDFLGLPSNIDTEMVEFDEPLRLYLVEIDSSLVQSGKFKIKNITRSTECWKVPFKYAGRYVASFEIDKIDGKYAISEIKQGDSAKWEEAERRIPKDKRKGARFVRCGVLTYLHMPAVDDLNLMPINSFAAKDTTSQAALSSPLKINTDLVREELKEEIVKVHRHKGKRK